MPQENMWLCAVMFGSFPSYPEHRNKSTLPPDLSRFVYLNPSPIKPDILSPELLKPFKGPLKSGFGGGFAYVALHVDSDVERTHFENLLRPLNY